jgi:hypothetical protein
MDDRSRTCGRLAMDISIGDTAILVLTTVIAFSAYGQLVIARHATRQTMFKMRSEFLQKWMDTRYQFTGKIDFMKINTNYANYALEIKSLFHEGELAFIYTDFIKLMADVDGSFDWNDPKQISNLSKRMSTGHYMLASLMENEMSLEEPFLLPKWLRKKRKLFFEK